MKKTTSGFTIVELLIVVVIIAILAAIIIVAYNGIQNRTNDAAVQSDMNASAKKLEIYKVDNGIYPATPSQLITIDFKLSGGSYAVYPTVVRNAVYCYSSDGSDYAFLFKSKSNNAYIVTGSSPSAKSFTATWSSSTSAGTLCSGLGSPFSTSGGTGYAYTTTGNPWSSWTGYNQ